MPKRILEKTSLEVSRLRSDGSFAVGGVSGLYLKIDGGSRAWVFRYVHGGHRRRMGLGSYPLVGLAEAREAARNALKLRLGGVDPLQARQAQREAARQAMARQVRFDDAAEAFITEHEGTWRSLKHAKQWRSTLETYAFPHICHLHLRAQIGPGNGSIPHSFRKIGAPQIIPLIRNLIKITGSRICFCHFFHS